MEDGFLESHREEYERRKAAWLRKKKRFPVIKGGKPIPEKPEDDAL